MLCRSGRLLRRQPPTVTPAPVRRQQSRPRPTSVAPTATAMPTTTPVEPLARRDRQRPIRLLPPAPTPAAPAPVQPLSPLPAATMTNPRDGAEYVYVPGGAFKMGSGEGEERAREDEKPQTSVNVDGFWLMRTEVTNGQYRRCVDAGACAAPNNARWSDPAYADHPVTGVTWPQANDYTAWVGGRLPTEAEWEKACRGTEGGIYPWGDAAPAEGLANFFPNTGGTMAVGSYSPVGDSPYGAADMAGNVWEWTSSRPDPYPYDAGDGRDGAGGRGQAGAARGCVVSQRRFCALREPVQLWRELRLLRLWLPGGTAGYDPRRLTG